MSSYHLFEGVPSAVAYDGGLGVNVGTAFYTTGPAWLTQIRYLQGHAVDAGHQSDVRWGPRTGALWAVDAGGNTTGMAAGPFTLPAPTVEDAWVTFDLPAPVALTPGQMYRVAVLHPDGGYPAVGHWFDGTADRVTGPVVVPAAGNVPGGMQGQYKYTGYSSDIPDGTFNATAYFADATIVDTLAAPSGTVFGADGTAYEALLLAGGTLTDTTPTL